MIRACCGIGFVLSWVMIIASLSAREPAHSDQPQAHQAAASASSTTGSGNAAVPQRRREGDLFQAQGKFESTGDRITFYADEGGEVFRVLENLALERIARILEDPADRGRSRKWSVTGVVTEYRGSNYLLIERAILKAR